MNAFVINHFGNNIKYFKYELYFLYMLRNNTKNDIIYLYSQNDTPYIYIEIIKLLKLNIKPIGYDDKKITYNINFKSSYKVFNLLRTCNYIFAYKLIEYEKICIVESDMIITENIDNIFELKTPSILYYRLNDDQLNKNLQIKLKNSDIKYIINKCSEESFTNGGVILFKPSLKIFEKLKNNILLIIKNKCRFPSETLFLYTIRKFYNLPITYNMSHFFVTKYNLKEKIKILHFNNTIFKPTNIIEDTGFNILNMKSKVKKNILLNFEKKYYKKHKKKINNIIAHLIV